MDAQDALDRLGLAVVQQATGINTVNYYAPTILEQSGLTASASLVATIAVGVTSVIMTILGIYLLGLMNRRPLLIIGFSGVAASQALPRRCASCSRSPTAVTYLILAAMMVFVAFVQCFIGTGVWLLLSEIFPLAIRGFAMGIAVFVLWTTNAAISFLVPDAELHAGSTGTSRLFVAVDIGSWIFVRDSFPNQGHHARRTEERFEGHGTAPIPDRRAHPRNPPDQGRRRRNCQPERVRRRRELDDDEDRFGSDAVSS